MFANELSSSHQGEGCQSRRRRAPTRSSQEFETAHADVGSLPTRSRVADTSLVEPVSQRESLVLVKPADPAPDVDADVVAPRLPLRLRQGGARTRIVLHEEQRDPVPVLQLLGWDVRLAQRFLDVLPRHPGKEFVQFRKVPSTKGASRLPEHPLEISAVALLGPGSCRHDRVANRAVGKPEKHGFKALVLDHDTHDRAAPSKCELPDPDALPCRFRVHRSGSLVESKDSARRPKVPKKKAGASALGAWAIVLRAVRGLTDYTPRVLGRHMATIEGFVDQEAVLADWFRSEDDGRHTAEVRSNIDRIKAGKPGQSGSADALRYIRGALLQCRWPQAAFFDVWRTAWCAASVTLDELKRLRAINCDDWDPNWITVEDVARNEPTLKTLQRIPGALARLIVIADQTGTEAFLLDGYHRAAGLINNGSTDPIPVYLGRCENLAGWAFYR
jgi:hypothetical protein